ncbi:MAG: HAMP domain-containing histidine kinase [Eubacterium sp.]|nr:HAMP domain-containing histidine kinase [Eubacterium sp.]
MKTRWIKSFEIRISFYILISLLITALAEFVIAVLIYRISSQLRYMGYRSSIMGPDGLTPGFRTIVLLAIGLAVFIFCFYYLISDYMKYIRKLANGMKNIAQGDFETEIPVQAMDEFGQIAVYMNQMQETVREIMERERVAERTKNDLITNVAHDLRTPLTSIIGYIGWVKDQPSMDADVRHKYLEIAWRKALHLEQMTNELFGFVKLEHREMTLHMSRIDLRQLLEQLLDEEYPGFEKAGLRAEFICREESVFLVGDGNLLARLFENLLNNAVKYGKDGKLIRLELELRNQMAVTRVINYGYVIPESELSHVFRKFYRVEQSRSQDTGGTGLGLAIVEQIVQLHSGSITVKSDLQGTVFEVVLPVNLSAEEKTDE